jgi:hypothetical protein
MAVVNARQDMNSDVAALYVESLNDLVDAEAMRVATAWHARIPDVIWSVFFVITVLAMLGFGYRMAIAGSRRTKAAYILILSFSLMIALIADLDRPQSGLFRVSQRPLRELQTLMEREADSLIQNSLQNLQRLSNQGSGVRISPGAPPILCSPQVPSR